MLLDYLGGLWNAIVSTQQMEGRALGMFLKSQRTWNSKPMERSDAELFKKTLAVIIIDINVIIQFIGQPVFVIAVEVSFYIAIATERVYRREVIGEIARQAIP